MFFKVGRVQFIVMSLILTGFMLFGRTFMFLWGGAGYEDSYAVTLCLIVPITVPLVQGLGVQIQRAKNMHRARSIVYLCISLINVVVSIPLVRDFGPIGAALGTGAALILGHGFFMNWYYCRKLEIDILGYWKQIASFIPSIIIPLFFGIIVNLILRGNSALVFLIKVVSYTFVYALSMRFIGFNSYEKVLFSSILRRVKLGK